MPAPAQCGNGGRGIHFPLDVKLLKALPQTRCGSCTKGAYESSEAWNFFFSWLPCREGSGAFEELIFLHRGAQSASTLQCHHW